MSEEQTETRCLLAIGYYLVVVVVVLVVVVAVAPEVITATY